jgi:hypothetical protein
LSKPVKNRKRTHKAVEERGLNNKTYRLQSVRCGKRGVNARQGKTRGQYVGKKLPGGRGKSHLVVESDNTNLYKSLLAGIMTLGFTKEM